MNNVNQDKRGVDGAVINLQHIKRMTVEAFIRWVPKPFIKKNDVGVPSIKVS